MYHQSSSLLSSGVITNGKKHHHNTFMTTTKRTNRHLAALDFLVNIPMGKEQSIKESGYKNMNRIEVLERKINHDDEDDANSNSFISNSNFPSTALDELAASPGDTFGFKKLPGKQCPTARVLQNVQYTYDDQSAEVKHWQESLLGRRAPNINIPTSSSSLYSLANNESIQQQSILSSRIFVCRSRAYPVMVYSIVKYDAGQEAKKKADAQKGLEVFTLPQRDWRGLSYKPLFKPLSEDDSNNQYFYERGYMYDPDSLDDPEMRFGTNYYNLSSAQVKGPILISIILYSNEKQLKENLNEMFREKHPQLPPSLTLSKIRSIKKAALMGAYDLDIEISTTAYAVIYFESLCLKGLVTKFNRRLTMCVCLLLATKFLENYSAAHRERLTRLLNFFDRVWEISRKEVFAAEFAAYVHLGFLLHIPHQHVHEVYTRLLKYVHKSSREYLRDDMETMYTQMMVQFGQENQSLEQRELDQQMDEEEEEEDVIDDVVPDEVSPDYEVSQSDGIIESPEYLVSEPNPEIVNDSSIS